MKSSNPLFIQFDTLKWAFFRTNEKLLVLYSLFYEKKSIFGSINMHEQ